MLQKMPEKTPVETLQKALRKTRNGAGKQENDQ